MTKASVRRPAGFDYGFRPTSYFEDLDPTTIVVASILGEERRKDVQARIASSDFDPFVWGEWLTESKLEDDIRGMIGRQHPCFMGGEYLPALEQDEIEIARVVYASATQDVTSIRARRRNGRILYRVVDEYDSSFELARKSSSKPLTFGELINFINQTAQDEYESGNGIVFSVIDSNLEYGGEPQTLRGFVTVASSFYPELARYYAEATEAYLDSLAVEEDEYEGEEAA
jgi:hypothetical protein